MFNPTVILLFIISFLDIVLGLFVFLKNSKEKAHQSFGLLSLALLIWINASFFQDAVSDFVFKYLFLQLDFASAVFGAIFLLLFCLDVSRSKIAERTSSRISLIIIPALLSAIIFFTRLILAGYEIIEGVISPVFGNLYIAYAVLIAVSLILAIGTLSWKYRKSSLANKAKFVYLLIGFSLSAVIAFITNILLTDQIKETHYYSLYSRMGSFSTILVPLFSGYAIIKHRLLNLKVIAAEVLSLGILVFSLIQFLQSRESELLVNGIIFAVLLFLVILLVRSIENEVKRKEELQVLSDRLSEANGELMKLDRLKSEFLSFASHQLKAPMTVVKGYASLIYDGSYGIVPEKVKETAVKVQQVADQTIGLVEDFLNLRKIEEGKMDYQFSQVNITELIRNIVGGLTLIAKQKKLDLAFEDSRDIFLKADGQKLRQVIQNLIENAIKYTDNGFVNVELKEKPDSVFIIVSDSGRGISKELLPNLFQQFSRDAAVKKIQGTGLGLYIAKEIITAHRGSIWAESEGEGKGARFCVKVPVEQREA